LGEARPKKDVSILLPACNEALQIRRCITKIEGAIQPLSNSYEIIVSEDGSTDGTDQIVAGLSEKNRNLCILHSMVRLGKGKAIKNALKASEGTIIIFMDVDLATNLQSLPEFLQLVKETHGMVIGSRHVKGSRVQRRLSRTIFSLAYNLLVRLLFFDGVQDHQCGFKAMSRNAADVILETMSDGFFFDTELILRCKKKGFQIVEIGVEWAEKRGRGESKVRLFREATRIGLDLLKFKLTGKD